MGRVELQTSGQIRQDDVTLHKKGAFLKCSTTPENDFIAMNRIFANWAVCGLLAIAADIGWAPFHEYTRN